jgi:hypothetical protein
MVVSGISRAILIVRPRLLSDLIRISLQDECDLEVISLHEEPSCCLEDVIRWRPEILVHSLPDALVPSHYSHLLAKCPRTLIVSISAVDGQVQVRSRATGPLQFAVSSWTDVTEMMRRHHGNQCLASRSRSAPAGAGNVLQESRSRETSEAPGCDPHSHEFGYEADFVQCKQAKQ